MGINFIIDALQNNTSLRNVKYSIICAIGM